jgi:hypothetical protein
VAHQGSVIGSAASSRRMLLVLAKSGRATFLARLFPGWPGMKYVKLKRQRSISSERATTADRLLTRARSPRVIINAHQKRTVQWSIKGRCESARCRLVEKVHE